MLKEAHLQKLVTKYGIPEAKARDLADAGLLASVSRDEAIQILELDGKLAEAVESGGILIRYPSAPDVMYAVRFDVPPKLNGREAKYLRPVGRPNRLYVPPGVDLDSIEEVWLTEGELKALSASLHGLPVIAVPGVWNWRSDTSNEDPVAAVAKIVGGGQTRAIPDAQALVEDLDRDWSGKRFILVYDSDIGQEHPAWPAFCRLAEQLYRLGAEQVKIVILPTLLREGKTGLDDYILLRTQEGKDAIAELRALAASVPEWVPLADGAERYGVAALSSGDPDRMRRGAAAILAAKGETGLVVTMKNTGIKGRMATALRKEAAEELAQIRARQEHKYVPPSSEKSTWLPTFGEAFPPARETPFAEFPIPPGFIITDDGRVIKIDQSLGAIAMPQILRAPAALAAHLVPADGLEDDVCYELWWWHYDQKWRRAQFPAGILFNSAKFDVLANKDVPVDSGNKNRFVEWLAALRDLQYDYPDRARIPQRIVVSRSGWHTLPTGREIFAVGRDIYAASGVVKGEAGKIQDDVDPDDPLTEWRDVSVNEKQLLEPIAAKGTFEAQLDTYLRWIGKYPLVGFFVGAAAAGPLMRTLVAEGQSDVCGFVVESTAPEAGHGKTLANRFAAGVWGVPEVGERGMIRTAHRTTVHSEILFAIHCDISCHVDETQLVRFSDTVAEWIYSLSLGSGKERGAKHGGGRKTRYFYTVLIISAEQSVLDVVNREGVHHRVLSLPPLFPEKSEFYRKEAEAAEKELSQNYGHLGRRYVEWLLNLPQRNEVIVEKYQSWRDLLAAAADAEVPTTGKPDGSAERNQTLKRLAKRAAACAAGLELLLRACGVDEARAKEITAQCLDVAWEYIMANAQGRPLLEKVLSALRSYVWENREAIRGLRKDEKPPAKWIGRCVKVAGKQYIALAKNPLVRLFREQVGIEYDTAAKALAKAGLLVTEGDRESRKEKRVRFGGARDWMLTIDASALFADFERDFVGDTEEDVGADETL